VEHVDQLPNLSPEVARSFDEEWRIFPQDKLPENEKRKIFADYFNIFPWEALPEDGGVGADLGCGSGRWASLMAPKVKELHCLEVSANALAIAKNNLNKQNNVQFHHASIGRMPFEDASLDFAYSLGVLHHIPDTEAALRSICKKLKPGAPFLIYLYYGFDNRPNWYRRLWVLSDKLRVVICYLPSRLKYLASQVIAFGIYWPLARMGRLLEKIGMLPQAWPLSYYRDKDIYVMRTDALDRFGTPLEKRFTRVEIQHMLERNGFKNVRFSNSPPYWVAVAERGEAISVPLPNDER